MAFGVAERNVPTLNTEPTVMNEGVPPSVEQTNQQQPYLNPAGGTTIEQTQNFRQCAPHPVSVTILNSENTVTVPVLMSPNSTTQTDVQYPHF